MAMQQGLAPSKYVGVSHRGIFYLLIFMGFFGIMIIYLLTGEAIAPQLISPEKRTVLRGYEGQDTQLTIKWRQGGITEEKRFPSRATRFVVCFFDPSVMPFCTDESMAILFASEPAEAIPRTKLGSPGFVNSVLDRLYPRYEYTYEVTLPSSVLDATMRWTVGACSGGTQLENCTFPMLDWDLRVTNRNLVATRIDDTPTATGVTFMVELENDGDTINEPYQISLKVWEILHDSSETQPLLDVNDPAAADAQTVITLEGREVSIDGFRNGTRSDLFAIRKPRTLDIHWVVEYPVVPHPNSPVPTSVSPCNSPDPCEVTPGYGRPALFAAFFKVDPNNRLLEFNEDDNVMKLRTIR